MFATDFVVFKRLEASICYASVMVKKFFNHGHLLGDVFVVHAVIDQAGRLSSTDQADACSRVQLSVRPVRQKFWHLPFTKRESIAVEVGPPRERGRH